MTDQNKQIEAVAEVRYTSHPAKDYLLCWIGKDKPELGTQLFAFPITAALMLEKAAATVDLIGKDWRDAEDYHKELAALYIAEQLRDLIPTDAQLALDVYVRERCMEVARRAVDMALDDIVTSNDIDEIIATVISEMRGK